MQSSIPHEHKAVDDTIRLIGQLEALRSHHLQAQAEPSRQAYHILAQQPLTALRRGIQASLFPTTPPPPDLWCPLKHLATARTLAEEITPPNPSDYHISLLTHINQAINSLWLEATGEDLGICSACEEDMSEASSPTESDASSPTGTAYATIPDHHEVSHD